MSYIFYNFGIPFSSETSALKHKDYISISKIMAITFFLYLGPGDTNKGAN